MLQLKEKKAHLLAVSVAMVFLVIVQVGFVRRQHYSESINAPLELQVTVIEVRADQQPEPGRRDPSELLVDAIIQIESGGIGSRVGRAGERGLMQVKRATWREVTSDLFGRPISFDDAFVDDVNRRVGKAYLAQLQAFLREYRLQWQADERSLLLACYNAGPTSVKQAGFDLDRLPRSTQGYVERASALHDHYLGDTAPVVTRILTAQRKRFGMG